MRIKELKQTLKTMGKDKIFKCTTPNPDIDTPIFTNCIYNDRTDILSFRRIDGQKENLTVERVLDFIEICDNINDNTLVTLFSSDLESNNENLVRYFATSDKSDYIGVVAKFDEDAASELKARAEAAIKEGWSDADFIQGAFDDGFTLEDFKYDKSAYEFAKRTKEAFGLTELREDGREKMHSERFEGKPFDFTDAIIATETYEGRLHAHYIECKVSDPSINLQEAFKTAAKQFLQTDSGKKALEKTCGNFTWSDAVDYLPEHVQKKNGFLISKMVHTDCVLDANEQLT